MKFNRSLWTVTLLNLTFMMLLTMTSSTSIDFRKTSASDISIIPSGYQFKEVDSKIVLTCNISEHLAPGLTMDGRMEWPVFKWKDPNQALIPADQNRIFSERIDPYKSKMYITRVQESDAGLYTCEVQTNEGLMIIASNNLFIYADINFVPTTTKVEALLDDPVVLECEAFGNPQPDISWKFNGRKLIKDGRYDMLRTGLRIKHVTLEAAGNYECRAQVVSQGNFKNLKISLTVLHAPIMSLPLHSPRVMIGKDAKLDCQAIGNPPVSYHWLRGNSRSGKSLYKGSVGLYTMKNVDKGDEGEYTCIVENKYGSQEATVDLRVSVPPKVKIPEKLVSVLEGHELILPCEASSSPLASFQWFKGVPGENLKGNNQTNERWSIQTSDVGVSKLKIKNVTKEDSGNYTCNASNEAGSDEKNIQVVVDFAPKVILKSPIEVYAWRGQQKILTCHVIGRPTPTITWVKDRFTYLGSTPHHTITNTKESADVLVTTLKLIFDEQLEASMYSDYSCTAKNLHGVETKTVSVKQAYHPELPRNLSVVSVTFDSFSLMSYEEGHGLTTSDPSVPLLTHWVVKFKKSKPPLTTTSSLSLPNAIHSSAFKEVNKGFTVLNFDAGKPLKVEGLESDTEYLVLVVAGNIVGESGSVKFNIKTDKFHEDEFFQADQGLMSKSALTKQEHLRLSKHMDERKRAKSFWDNVSIGLIVVVVGLLMVVTIVVLSLAAKNWRKNSPAKSGRYKINSPSEENSQFEGHRVRVADDHDIDNLTMKTNRPRTSINDDSPFADLKDRYGSLPKKFNDGSRSIRPFDVVNNNNNNDNINSDNNSQQNIKMSWPMSSTLPRSRKMEVHVNRTASVMEMIEEKKTKQSQAWKEMLKLTTADLDEDSMVSRDEEEEHTNEEDDNVEDEGVYEETNQANLPPPPSDLLPSPIKSPNSVMTSEQQQFCSTPSTVVARSNANVNCKQGPFDASHVDDDDEISFIDDEEEDDVIITHHSVPGNANKRVHFEGKSFKQY